MNIKTTTTKKILRNVEKKISKYSKLTNNVILLLKSLAKIQKILYLRQHPKIFKPPEIF